MNGIRAQAYTLEGIIAAIVLASAILYGMQAVDVAPWAGGTNDQQAEALRTQAKDLLSTAAVNGTLENVVTCVGLDGDPHQYLAHRPQYLSAINGDDVTAFGRMLAQTFARRDYNYNVTFDYWDDDADERKRTEVYNPGQRPDGDAITVSHRVTLYDGMQVNERTNQENCRDRSGETLDERSDLYVDDVHDSSTLYNVVEVRIVVW